MPEGLTSIEDLKVVISAETESLGKGLENASAIISRFTGDADGKLKGFDGALAKIGSTVTSMRGSLGMWAEAATAALTALEKLDGIAERAAKAGGAEEEYGGLRSAVTDLVSAISDVMVATDRSTQSLAYMKREAGALWAALDPSNIKGFDALKQILSIISDGLQKVQHEARRLTSEDTWRVHTVEAEMRRAEEIIESFKNRLESMSANGSNWFERMFGYGTDVAIEDLKSRISKYETELERLGALRTRAQWKEVTVDTGGAELIKGLEREVEALRLRAAVLGMSAAESAVFTAQERIRQEALKTGKTIDEEATAALLGRMRAYQQQITAHADALRERQMAEREAERQEKGRESVLQGLDREVLQMRQKQRALTDTSAATRAQEIEERALAQARQRGVEVTEEMIIQVRAYANEIAKGEDALKNHQKLLDQFNRSNEIVFRGLETTISRYMQGTQINFKQTVSSMLQDLAMLTLKMTVLQPLQQGMASGFSGLMGGGGIGSLFGGFRAEGGPVDAGRAYVVGERGPEMFIPRETGAVVSNDQLRGAAQASRSSAPVTVQIHNHVDARGAYPESIADIKRAIAEQQQSLPGRVVEVVHDARERGGL